MGDLVLWSLGSAVAFFIVCCAIRIVEPAITKLRRK